MGFWTLLRLIFETKIKLIQCLQFREEFSILFYDAQLYKLSDTAAPNFRYGKSTIFPVLPLQLELLYVAFVPFQTTTRCLVNCHALAIQLQYSAFQGPWCKRVLVQETAAVSETLSSDILNTNWRTSPTALALTPCLCLRKWVRHCFSCWNYLTSNDISRHQTLRCFVFRRLGFKPRPDSWLRSFSLSPGEFRGGPL